MRTTLLCLLVLVGCSNEGDACFAKARQEVKDPQSATLTSWKYYDPWHVTQIEMRASNSFGAFGKVYATCHRNGSVQVTDNVDTWTLQLGVE